jgi:hypothetical protein
VRRLARRTGHRGAFLAFLTILDVAYGYSLWATAPPFRTLDLFLPWQAWGYIWVGVGAVCAASVFAHRDRFAFACAAAVKTAWAGIMADTWIVQGVARGWVSMVVWACFALTVLVIASWPEPPERADFHMPEEMDGLAAGGLGKDPGPGEPG